MCGRKKCFVVFYVFYFLAGVCVGTLNLIASIPDPSIHIIGQLVESIKENHEYLDINVGR